MSYRRQPKGFLTKAIHVGNEPEQWASKCVIPAICPSTTYKQEEPGVFKQYEYCRTGNPTRSVLQKCMASLDNAKYGLAYASGMGAGLTVMQLLSQGDHVLLGDDVYGGTSRLMRGIMGRLGIEYSFSDATNLDEFKKELKPNTKLVWVESPTNPMMKIVDIEAVSKLVKERDILLAVDNTFLTSYFQRPLELGADLVVYSLTKYMNGHTDVVMGGICTDRKDLYDRLQFLQNACGVVPSPFDCYQVNRGLKTLALRMDKHMENGLAVAKYLEAHSFVEKVLHPGLPSHPQHQLLLKQAYGYSSVFSFYIKGGETQARSFLKALKLFSCAESLGGFESLAELPCIMTHAAIPEAERKKLGIKANLIRLSVGLEDIEDLIEDVKNALFAAEQA